MEEHCSPEVHGLPLRQGSTPVLDTQAGNIDRSHGTPPWKCRATSTLDFNDQSFVLRGQLRVAEVRMPQSSEAGAGVGGAGD